MQDRWNVVLGLTSSVWSAAIALAVVPFYLRFLGIEAYGLIGFFVALQSLFVVLDLGLSATINREVARCRESNDITQARDLLHTLAIIYWITAVLIGLGVVLASDIIAVYWLRDNNLSSQEVGRAVALMGVVIAFRWPVAIYSGALIGAGKLTHVSIITIFTSTITNIGAVLILWLVAPTITAFFSWQALCTVLQVAATAAIAWRVLPGIRPARFDKAGLLRIWRFSAGLSVAGIIGTIFMQSDKVVLSRIVPLEELGGYVLAGTVARVLYIVLSPAFNIIYPRMTAMAVSGATDQLIDYYRHGTRLLIAAIIPCSAFAAFFAYDLLLVWTGDPDTAAKVAPLVPLMIAGTAMNGIMHFPYALQLAAGRSNLPAAINLVLLVLFVPMLVVLALRYGVWGGAIAWAALNGAYVFVGTWLTHRAVLPGLGPRWLTRDVAVPTLVALSVTGLGALAAEELNSAFARISVGAIFALIAMLLSALSSPPTLAYLQFAFGRLLHRSRPSASR